MRILIVRTDRIGDLILSTPAIATVRASFPQARITMVTSPYNHIAVERNDDVDELIDLPRGIEPATFGARFRGWDVAIALAPRATDLRIVGASRAKVRVGYTYVRRYLARATARLYVNRLMISEADPRLSERDPRRAVRHEVDQLLDMVALAGARQRVTRLRLDIRDADRAAAAALPDRPIVLHVGRRWFERGSTLAGTVELARALQALGHPLVVTLAPDCEEEASAFAFIGVDKVLRGLPFFAWAGVLERASCVVTVDTAATHVASAVRRPTVVAFEHRFFRLNAQEWAPYGVPHASVRKPERADDASLTLFRDEVVRAVATLTN